MQDLVDLIRYLVGIESKGDCNEDSDDVICMLLNHVYESK